MKHQMDLPSLSKKCFAHCVACLALATLGACGDDGAQTGTDAQPKAASGNVARHSLTGISLVKGWPNYVAMGTVTLNKCTVNTDPSLTCNDEQPHPVDAVFKYAGYTGKGDRGYIPFPGAVNGSLKFVDEMSKKDLINQRPVRPVMVQYTANYSNDGQPIGTEDFSPDNMSKNLINLALNSAILNGGAKAWNSAPVYGSIIISPDALGYIQQNSPNNNGGMLGSINARLASTQDSVNIAVARVIAFMNLHVTWNNQTFYPYGVTQTTTPAQMALSITSGTWTPDPTSKQTWPADTTWYPTVAKSVKSKDPSAPDFSNDFTGSVQANNWIVQQYGAKNITFGWQDNLWASGSSDWVRNTDPTSGDYAQNIAKIASDPVLNFLAAQRVFTGTYKPDFIVLDRFEMDDTNAIPYGWFFNDTGWKNLFTFASLISTGLTPGQGNVPVMLWQMPGGHIQTISANETDTRNRNGATLSDYLFGDKNLTTDSSMKFTNVQSYWYTLPALPASYYSSCPNCSTTDYLQKNRYNWGQDNGNLKMFAENAHVFAVLWGGGQTTGINVIYPDTVGSDGGWLANKVTDYYKNPQPVVP